MLRKLFKINELLCCFDVKVLVCKAMKNVQVLMAEKRRTNDERRTTNERTDWSEFSRFDWYEFRSIGTNSERLVRIPNDWSEFRTNDEFDVATDVNASDVVKFVKVLNAQKKIGVD